MEEVKCSYCDSQIREREDYYFYDPQWILCSMCEKSYGVDWQNPGAADICTRGTQEWWELPADVIGQKPEGEKMQEVKEESPQGVVVCKGTPKVNVKTVEVLFTQETYNQMFGYIDETPIEISGVGRIKRIIEGDKISFVIHELFLLKQRNTSASTHLDAEELSNFLIDRVRNELPVGDIKFWWHSHNTMGAFWSGTDDACCDGFEIEGREEGNWYLSIVANKRREMKCRLDIYKPYRITFDELTVKVMMNLSTSDKKRWSDEVREKCTENSYPRYTAGNTQSSYIPEHTGRRPDLFITNRDIFDTYKKGRQGELRYYRDMSDEGQKIEVLHYSYTDDLYRLFRGNDKVPVGHKVPSLKNLERARDWYLDRNGHQCSKTYNRILKNQSQVTDEDQMLFYKYLPSCACEWCGEQKILIGFAQDIRNEKDGGAKSNP